MEKQQESVEATDRDKFFDLTAKRVEELRKDESVSHVFVIAVHGNNATEETGAGVSFMHNMLDDVPAAQMVNNIAAHIFFNGVEHLEQQQKN